MKVTRPVLGRGLDAILPRAVTVLPPIMPAKTPSPFEGTLPLNQIFPNPDQPRKNFDPERLEALAASLKRDGVLQPILVKPAGDNRYTIIAGERRWQAARIAGLSELPVIIKNPDPKNLLGLALIENLQRENLNPIDEAMAYEKLYKDFGMHHDEIADRVGKSRSAITNTMRLLVLPEPILAALREGRLSPGQARPLLTLEKNAALLLFKRIESENLSAREIEEIVKGKSPSAPKKKKALASDIEMRLSREFGRKVQFVGNDKKGHVRIDYYSKEDFINLVDRLIATK